MLPGYIYITYEQAAQKGLTGDTCLFKGCLWHHLSTGYAFPHHG